MKFASWHLPYKDELLSSWLARVAVHSGCDPLNLTGAIWPKWRIWTVDVDRGLSDERTIQAAQWFGCEPGVVTAATLEDMLQRLLGMPAPQRPVLPWIVALGCRNRLHYAGLPCCPLCLANDPQPFFRRTWRLAFVVGCAVHGTRLIDRCPSCHTLITPHRCIGKLGTLAHCSACGHDMRRYRPAAVDADALAFQSRAMAVLSQGNGLWEGQSVSASQWFAQMRSMVLPSRCPVVRHEVSEADLRPNDLMLEMQSPREREARFCRLASVLRQSTAHDGTRKASKYRACPAACTKSPTFPLPVAKERVQADWERWLRRSRLW